MGKLFKVSTTDTAKLSGRKLPSACREVEAERDLWQSKYERLRDGLYEIMLGATNNDRRGAPIFPAPDVTKLIDAIEAEWK